MAQATEAQLLAQLRLNYLQVLNLLTGFGPGNPTPAQVAAFFTGLNALNAGAYQQITGPGALTHSIGDETYNWTEYQQFVVGQLETLRVQQQQADGPFWLTSRART